MEYLNKYVFPIGAVLCFGMLAMHSLKHYSHPGAALWVIALILFLYLREIVRVGQERNDQLAISLSVQKSQSEMYERQLKVAEREAELREEWLEKEKQNN